MNMERGSVNIVKKFNFVITTDESITPTSSLQGLGWVGVNIFEHQSSFNKGITGASTENIALAQIYPSETFSDFFSGASFGEFEEQILGDTALFSSDYFPSNTYGIDMSQVPSDIPESSTLTCAEKGTLMLAISLRGAGHYVLVISREEQTSYQNFLKKYNILFQKI